MNYSDNVANRYVQEQGKKNVEDAIVQIQKTLIDFDQRNYMEFGHSKYDSLYSKLLEFKRMFEEYTK